MPSDILPYAADASQSLPEQELKVLRHQYDIEREKGYLGVQTRFNLAWGLVKSEKEEDATEGVKLLMDIYREEPSRRRECLYYLALGHYKLRNYDEARRFNNLLLTKEPNNMQSQSLSQLIESEVTKEGVKGMVVIGGLAALGAALAVQLFRSSRR